MEDFLFKTDGKYPCIWVTEYGGAALYKNVHITQNIVDLNSYVMQKVKNASRKSSKSSSKSPGKKSPKWQTYQDTLILFNQKKTLKEISTQRELGLQTIEWHITHLYLQGDISLMQIMTMIELGKAKLVKWVIESDAILEDIELKSIKQKLEDAWEKNISYFEIKLSLAMMEKWDL